MTRCQEWRTCAPAEIAPLLVAEVCAWRDELDWDVAAAWRTVEPARRSGHLAGFVARDAAGRIVGWTSFLLHRGCLQVLAFVAPHDETAVNLVDAMLDSREARGAHSFVVCVRAASPGLAPALASRGFLIDPNRYLATTLDSGPAEPTGLQTWASHGDAVARLLARAYAGAPRVRAFALSGTMGEWREYVTSLLGGTGCGRFLPDLSFVVPGERSGTLAAAVIVTDLGPSTVHVAQIAVDPAVRGLGLGSRLMRAARTAAAACGYEQMTLLVAGSNRQAVAMYEGLGFRDRASFVVATRRQPILSTSRALATGGDRTRL
jgi:ribosomal protein S18 acetylase RimI-like enzyme